jgi:hypothetical protein
MSQTSLPADGGTPTQYVHAPERVSAKVWGLVAVVIGLIITSVLVWTSWTRFDQDESRLLNARVQDAGLLLTSVLPTVQTPLASASELAVVTEGDVSQFQAFAADYVGPGRPFSSLSLWSLSATRPLVVAGSAPLIAQRPGLARATFGQASSSSRLGVIGFFGSGTPRLGYAYVAPGHRAHYAVYAESRLPSNRRSAAATNPAFSQFNYALFLGKSADPHDLIEADVRSLPVTGASQSAVVPFGDNEVTLVMSSRVILIGSLSADYRWIIAVTGLLLSLLAGLLTQRLLQQRRDAERLAERLDGVAHETESLLSQQRLVAETLQRALLPAVLSEVPGAEVAARYLPGVQGMEIGGDWYDVIPYGDGRSLIVVGDVSGKGLNAAAIMASLRFATRAYAGQGDSPVEILTKLSDLMRAEGTDNFATVLCIGLDIGDREMTLANAGHPPPFLLNGTEGSFVGTPVGVPVGVAATRPYQSTTVTLPAHGTLVAFTDGLIERRNESLDTSLERFRQAAQRQTDRAPEVLLTALVGDLVGEGEDDTAILAVTWPA